VEGFFQVLQVVTSFVPIQDLHLGLVVDFPFGESKGHGLKKLVTLKSLAVDFLEEIWRSPLSTRRKKWVSCMDKLPICLNLVQTISEPSTAI